MKNGKDILEEVLEEFGRLAAIPRKSGHEKAVSDFLTGYLKEMGLSVVQDEVFNIIADLAASPGCENAPLTILQGHMDMVCVAEKGYAYDPLKDPIKLKRTEEYLEAEGTSLGADDGIGLAEILYLLKHQEIHGPLRAIFTVDEEVGMTGACHLDKKYLEDGNFLINCDSENYDVLTVGCAGSASLDFSRRMKETAPQGSRGWHLEIGGLKGGHSGERIGDGRGNAIRSLAAAISALQERGVLELAFIEGGKASNVIPSTAKALIVTDLSEDELNDTLREQEKRFRQMYGPADEAHFSLEEAELPEKVFAQEDTMRLLRLIRIIHVGVYAMNQISPTLVETSANLGIIRTEGGTVSLDVMPRSDCDGKLEEFCRMGEDWGSLSGFEVKAGMKSPGWAERKDSPLTRLMTGIFQEQNGKPMRVETIHAGVECGWHFRKNPSLDIVSVGVTTLEIHSPRERLVLSTVEPQVRLISETLRKISGLKFS